MVSMTSLNLSQKPLTPGQTRESQLSAKLYGSTLHTALVLKQVLEGYP